VDISFYLHDQPTVEASIFLNPTTGVTTNTTDAQLQTNSDGFFEFWVGDQWEVEGGYEFDQKFRLEWYRAGIIAGAISPVDIFPPLAPVDETSTGQGAGEKEKKNKLISNALAYKWNQHIDLLIPSAAPHDLRPVVACNNNEQFNRVVSNALVNRMMTAAISGSTVTLDASAADMFTSLCGILPYAGNFILTAGGSANDILHGLGNEWPIVQVIKMPEGEVVIPNTIKSVSGQRTVVEMALNDTYRVTIIG
jgi:hypothetical protein